MDRFEEILDEISKYGISKINIKSPENDLKKWLVLFCTEYLQIESELDENEYLDFDKSSLSEIAKIVRSNFPDFDFYNVISDVNINYEDKAEVLTGDTNDNLSDIIIDLMEVK